MCRYVCRCICVCVLCVSVFWNETNSWCHKLSPTRDYPEKCRDWIGGLDLRFPLTLDICLGIVDFYNRNVFRCGG